MKQVLFPTVLGFLVLAAAQPSLAASIDSPSTVDRDGSIHPTLPSRTTSDASTSDRDDTITIAQSENPVAQDSAPSPPASTSADPNTGALNFNPPGATTLASASSSSDAAVSIVNAPPSPHSSSPSPTSSPPSSTKDLFANGSDSVVARVVGAAEGTRNPDGSPTSLYEGHRDPGNGVWNRGTFSYQFGNEENLSPEEADKRQVAKIKRIYESVMRPQAQQHGLDPLTLSEELNGIDLINQAPLAVTETGGYIERLAEAKQKKGLSGEKAILEARVWSFWDPQRNGWDAPGLRAYDDQGKEASIRHDQERRMGMIDQALDSYQQQKGAIAQTPSTPAPQPRKVATPAPAPQPQKVAARSTQTQAQKRSDPNQIADLIIFNHS